MFAPISLALSRTRPVVGSTCRVAVGRTAARVPGHSFAKAVREGVPAGARRTSASGASARCSGAAARDPKTRGACSGPDYVRESGRPAWRPRERAPARISQDRSQEEGSMKHRILIVEDDAVFLRPLLRVVEAEGYEVRATQSGEGALELLRHEDFDLVLTDKLLPKMDGIELVREIKAGHPEVAVVVPAHATVESAVEALRLGAVDFLLKPFDLTEAVLVIRHAIELQDLRLAKGARVRRNQAEFSFDRIVTQSECMREVFELARSVVELDTTVLIEGETGVGKELLARAIHYSGSRRDQPFLAVNCAAIPGELFESELFGFRKGAFTGATESRRGLFQRANGGTLLLDEIGEMSLHLQAKLLRVIEERRVAPIGADQSIEVDVRLLASTNRNLQAEVEQRRFRPDLFYR